MLATLLKALGGGLVVTGTQDQLFEDEPNPYNLAATVIGAVSWLTGFFLERRQQASLSSSQNKSACSSTKVIQEALVHVAGVGIVNSITHMVKHRDTLSANIANLSSGISLPYAIKELDIASQIQILPLKWEKSRFLLILAADYIASAGLKPMLNGEKPDLMALISLSLGLSLSIGEWIYGRKHDKGLNLQSALMRRGFKIGSILSLFFSAYDFILKQNDKYAVADDAYQALIGAILFAVVVKIAQLSKANNIEVDLFEVKVDAPEGRHYTAIEAPKAEAPQSRRFTS